MHIGTRQHQSSIAYPITPWSQQPCQYPSTACCDACGHDPTPFHYKEWSKKAQTPMLVKHEIYFQHQVVLKKTSIMYTKLNCSYYEQSHISSHMFVGILVSICQLVIKISQRSCPQAYLQHQSKSPRYQRQQMCTLVKFFSTNMVLSSKCRKYTLATQTNDSLET